MVTGGPAPAILCARTRKSTRAPVGRSFTSSEVRSISPGSADTHAEPVGGAEAAVRQQGRQGLQPAAHLPVAGRPGRGQGARPGGALTRALPAVLHTVAVQASGSRALRGPPLEGDGGVGDVLHRQVGGLTGRAWAEGRQTGSERGCTCQLS